MDIVELSDNSVQAWDGCVSGAAGATVYHLAGWRSVMTRSFGLDSHFLLAEEGGQTLGVLPLLHVKSRLAGHFFTSLPGGICCRDDRAAAPLLQHAVDLVRAHKARYLILRDSYRKWDLPELVTNEDHCSLRARLSPDWDQVLKGIKRKERQLAGQGVRAGVQVVDGDGTLAQFYPAYSRAMRDKGTPTPGLLFFKELMQAFPTHMKLMVIRREAQVLGGGFIAPFRDTVHCAWAGVLREFYELRPSHLLYWETMRFASANGYAWVDFGRSRWNSGTFAFKQAFGGEPRPLYQQYYLNGIDHAPAVGGSRNDDAQYRLFVRVWSRLPLRATELLGPQLSKRMPFG
jgi:FemAB-related protein (PEP-CTERM system-associated)